MKSLRLISFFTLGTLAFTASAAAAATSVTKVLPAKPIIVASLSASNEDEISSALTSSTSLIVAGTVAGALGDWVTTPSLGGTDGFIASISYTGVRNWDLRLGGTGDEIATSVLKDSSGNYWVLGSASKPAIPNDSPTPTSTPSPVLNPVLNPDGVVVDPVPTSPESFDQLTVWKVSRMGSLLATYTFAAPGVIFPRTLTPKGALFSASGEVVSSGTTKKFTILFDQNGNFSQLILAKLEPPTSTSSISILAGPNHWLLSTSSGPIVGIPGWKPKRALSVAVLYSRAGKILDARYFTITPKISLWQTGIGLVCLGEQGKGFGLTIVNPLAG